MTTTLDRLYETDYYAWTLEQAAILRRMADQRVNVELDLGNLAKEVEDLGRSGRSACRVQIRRIILHLLKLQYAPAEAPRRAWRATITNARARLIDDLTPTLQTSLRKQLPELYAAARDEAILALVEYDEDEAAARLPMACPYRLDEITEMGWFPGIVGV